MTTFKYHSSFLLLWYFLLSLALTAGLLVVMYAGNVVSVQTLPTLPLLLILPAALFLFAEAYFFADHKYKVASLLVAFFLAPWVVSYLISLAHPVMNRNFMMVAVLLALSALLISFTMTYRERIDKPEQNDTHWRKTVTTLLRRNGGYCSSDVNALFDQQLIWKTEDLNSNFGTPLSFAVKHAKSDRPCAPRNLALCLLIKIFYVVASGISTILAYGEAATSSVALASLICALALLTLGYPLRLGIWIWGNS